MTRRSEFFRQQKQSSCFVQLLKVACYLAIVFSCSSLGFSVVCFLNEMDRLSYSSDQTVVYTPKNITVANFELVDVSTGTIREVTAYNSLPEQTDNTPCISANGSNICERFAAGECLIAGNFAKFETKHYIEGIGECTLIDRMSSKYPERVDIFFGFDKQAAINFGRQKLLVKSL